MYLLVIFFPLVGFLGAGLFGRFFGGFGSYLLTSSCLFLAFLVSLFIFYEVGFCGCPCYVGLVPWIDSGLFLCFWGFQFDALTACMLIVITFVSFLVHLYSGSYMEADPHLARFMCYLSLFTFCMLMLVTSDNFMQLFFGWEGVGLSSYLLINFWFTRIQANKSAMKAMVVNRVGDFGLSIGIFLIFFFFKSLKFSVVFPMATFFSEDKLFFLFSEWHGISIICFFLFIGAVGKSAQLGLHTWLPDAMEGPTPVSALIHAATMVTAGVFLMVRCSSLFEYAPTILSFVTLLGATTAFLGSTVGLVQNDLKKVIAYSTCSQLGYMVFVCGVSAYSVGFFHLVNHAFFKALLFLTAGAVIHSMADEQDMRRLGGLVRILPFSYIMVFIGSLSLMGFPFLTGFYSKDVILEVVYSHYSIPGLFSFWLGVSSAFLTAFYSWRLLYFTFLGPANGFRFSYESVHESPPVIIFSLVCLCIGSIFFGFFFKDMFIGLGSCFWGNSIFVLPANDFQIEAEFIPWLVKLCPVYLSLVGGGLSFLFYHFFYHSFFYFFSSNFSFFRSLYIFLNQKWFFDRFFNEHINYYFLKFGYSISFKTIDKGILEFFGPLGFEFFIVSSSRRVLSFQTGFLSHSFFIFLIGLFFLLWFFFSFFSSSFFLNIDDRILFLFFVLAVF